MENYTKIQKIISKFASENESKFLHEKGHNYENDCSNPISFLDNKFLKNISLYRYACHKISKCHVKNWER